MFLCLADKRSYLLRVLARLQEDIVMIIFESCPHVSNIRARMLIRSTTHHTRARRHTSYTHYWSLTKRASVYVPMLQRPRYSVCPGWLVVCHFDNSLQAFWQRGRTILVTLDYKASLVANHERGQVHVVSWSVSLLSSPLKFVLNTLCREWLSLCSPSWWSCPFLTSRSPILPAPTSDSSTTATRTS